MRSRDIFHLTALTVTAKPTSVHKIRKKSAFVYIHKQLTSAFGACCPALLHIKATKRHSG